MGGCCGPGGGAGRIIGGRGPPADGTGGDGAAGRAQT